MVAAIKATIDVMRRAKETVAAVATLPAQMHVPVCYCGFDQDLRKSQLRDYLDFCEHRSYMIASTSSVRVRADM